MNFADSSEPSCVANLVVLLPLGGRIMFRYALDGVHHKFSILCSKVVKTCVHIGSGLHSTVVCNNSRYEHLSQCVFRWIAQRFHEPRGHKWNPSILNPYIEPSKTLHLGLNGYVGDGKILNLGLRASGFGLRIWFLGFRVSGLGYRSWGSGSKEDFGVRV